MSDQCDASAPTTEDFGQTVPPTGASNVAKDLAARLRAIDRAPTPVTDQGAVDRPADTPSGSTPPSQPPPPSASLQPPAPPSNPLAWVGSPEATEELLGRPLFSLDSWDAAFDDIDVDVDLDPEIPVVMGPPTSRAGAAAHWQVTSDRGATVTVSHSLLIGRAADGTVEEDFLVVASQEISRRHCELVVRQGQVFVHDLGSTNGTDIRRLGRRARVAPRESIMLMSGDELYSGSVFLCRVTFG